MWLGYSRNGGFQPPFRSWRRLEAAATASQYAALNQSEFDRSYCLFHRLDADRQPQQSIGDAESLSLLQRQAAVRSGGGVAHRGAAMAERRGERNPRRLQKRF